MPNQIYKAIKKLIKDLFLARLPLNDRDYYQLRFWLANNRLLNLNDPQTLSEKLNWWRLKYDLAKYSPFVDKLAVRDYIEEKIGEQHLISLLGVYESGESIPFSTLPTQFYLTANHGSNMNYFCFDKAKLDKKKVNKLCIQWLRTDYSRAAREKNYRGIKPKLLCFELLADEVGNIPVDYKFFCFHGEPKCIQVDLDRFTDHHRNFYSLDWELLPILIDYPAYLQPLKKPGKLTEMIEVAKILSSDFPFVRVDLYQITDRVLFGELTFTPNGCVPKISHEADLLMGAWFNIDKL